ncbi:hypothetical protein BV898_17523 [Hypsibius exemplaris]|uniref:Uncharacterized protein n=1 Tax=Hypsibius exemplaris TaxID=2072580 RepID=A0A9X6RM90_HYPEX|nr:hypothetical protein BV898_17523 [Hypsibius exemplaris]
MKAFLSLLVVLLAISCTTAAPHNSLDRLRRDVVDTAKSLYKTVALGTKAVFNDMVGNNHVAVESYRQAQDESRKVGPAFSGIFVNPNKVTVAPGPPPKENPEWNL